jgi:hypothetical protein
VRSRKTGLSVLPGGGGGGASPPTDEKQLPLCDIDVANAPPAAPTPLAVIEGGRARLTERDLDDAVDRVRAAKEGMGLQGWALGHALADICDRQLWKLRPGADRPQGWRTFESFCRSELEVGARQAYRLIEVSRQYTEEQARGLGATVIQELIKLPPGPARDAVEADVRENKLTVSETRERVERVKPPRSRAPGPPSKRAQRAELATLTPEKLAQERAETKKRIDAMPEVTWVGRIDKVVTVPLHLASRAADRQPWVRKRKADSLLDAHADVDLENGITVRFTLVEKEGLFFVKLESRREDNWARDEP